MTSRSESKKRSCEILESQSQPEVSGKLWNVSGSDDPDDQDTEADDPRKEEDWKIQKRRGYIPLLSLNN